MRGDGADAGVTTTVANDDKRPTPSADGVAAAGAHYLMMLSGEMSAFDLPLDDGSDDDDDDEVAHRILIGLRDRGRPPEL